jgi:hypothetical protein
MMVISVPSGAFLAIIFEGESMLSYLLINFIKDIEIDGLLVELECDINSPQYYFSHTPPKTLPPIHNLSAYKLVPFGILRRYCQRKLLWRIRCNTETSRYFEWSLGIGIVTLRLRLSPPTNAPP